MSASATPAAEEKITLPAVVMKWALAAALFYGSDVLLRWHSAAYEWTAVFGILGVTLATTTLVKSLNGLDTLRDRWRLASAFKERADAHGRARRGTVDDAEKSGLLGPAGWMVGLLDGRVLRYAGESSWHYFAPARVGKTLSILANLVSWRPAPRFEGDDWLGSMVGFDPKGEIAATTSSYQSETAERHRYYFNPFADELEREMGVRFPSHCYSGFGNLDANSRNIKADVEAKMALALPIPPDADSQTVFFRTAGREIGTVNALGLLAAGERVTFPRLLEKVRLTGEPLLEWVAAMRTSKKFAGALSQASGKVWELKITAPEQHAGGASELENVLMIYDQHGTLADQVNGDQFDGAWLKQKPCYCLILLPTKYLESHAHWANWMIANLIEDAAQTKNNRRVLFVIDEAPRLGVIGNLAKAIELYPSAGISVCCAWLSFNAGVLVYGREGFQKLLDTADLLIYRSIRGLEDLKSLSELIGDRTILDVSRSVDPQSDKPDYRTDYKSRPVLDVNDLRTLGAEKQVVLFRNDPVYICDAIDPRQSATLMGRLDPNPYHRHE